MEPLGSGRQMISSLITIFLHQSGDLVKRIPGMGPTKSQDATQRCSRNPNFDSASFVPKS
uniref:Uncharacterized protein n=1 Tax=Leersia perrieri TaxID=77586 RepID=A0A0D9XD22_9ORYZ